MTCPQSHGSSQSAGLNCTGWQPSEWVDFPWTLKRPSYTILSRLTPILRWFLISATEYSKWSARPGTRERLVCNFRVPLSSSSILYFKKEWVRRIFLASKEYSSVLFTSQVNFEAAIGDLHGVFPHAWSTNVPFVSKRQGYQKKIVANATAWTYEVLISVQGRL